MITAQNTSCQVGLMQNMQYAYDISSGEYCAQ